MSNSQDRDFLEKADMFSDFHEAGSDKEREQVLKSAREIVREGVYAKGGDIGGVINNEKRADMLVSSPNKIKAINSMIREKGLTLVYYRMSGTWSTHSLKHPELIVTANPFWEGENDTLTMELAEDGVGDILEEKTIEMPLNLRSSQFIDWYFNQVNLFFDESSTRDGVYAEGGALFNQNQKNSHISVYIPEQDEFYSVEEIRIQDEDDVLDAGHPYLVLGEPQITYNDLFAKRTGTYAKGGKTNFETPKHFSSFLVDDVRTQLKKQGYSEAKINKAFQGVNVWMSKDRVPAGVAQANIVDAKGLLDNLPTEDFRELTMNVPITIKVEDPQYDSSGKQILYAKGGEVKKKGNEMLIGGLAGVLIGIFLGK